MIERDPAREVGSSERELVRVSGRYALWLRIAIVVATGAFGVVVAGADLALGTAFFVVVAGGCGVVQVLWELPGRRPGWFVVLDGAVVVFVGLSQLHSGPQPTSSWVFAVASISTVTCHFEWSSRPVAGWVVAGLSVGAYTAGNLLAGPNDGLVGLCLRLVVQMLLTWVSFRFIQRAARAADLIAGRAAERRRRAAVAAARRAAESEYLAMLHDTASTTLLMVSLGVPDRMEWLSDRARRDLEVLGTVPHSAARELDLVSMLSLLTEDPHLRIELAARGPLVMPAAPALAIFLGTREALNNVRRHAGATDASLCARRDFAGRVVVELSDRGRGFRQTDVPAHRRGISGSIVGRMSDVGGSVKIYSQIGAGTSVCWTWPDG